jgi:acyl-CoA synthetase (AMP-forming)/AMP-acid ligase II
MRRIVASDTRTAENDFTKLEINITTRDAFAYGVPLFVAGLGMRGPTLMSGYLDDPHLNRAAFVGGWFRTADSGAWTKMASYPQWSRENPEHPTGLVQGPEPHSLSRLVAK